jgi:hypothetical protein
VPSATGYLISLLGFGLYAFWSLGGAGVLAFYRKRESHYVAAAVSGSGGPA